MTFETNQKVKYIEAIQERMRINVVAVAAQDGMLPPPPLAIRTRPLNHSDVFADLFAHFFKFPLFKLPYYITWIMSTIITLLQ